MYRLQNTSSYTIPSNMLPFNLTLSNNGTVTGLHSIPPPPPSSSTARPLIVALHGGFYNSQYFDATPTCSASPTSIALNIPFVAIDRPSYGGTSSILPIPEDSDFPQETGIWLHRFILPKLWTEFGVPNGCSCIVLLCHSLGVTGGVVAAALHAESQSQSQSQSQMYPLGGLIASGMGNTSATQTADTNTNTNTNTNPTFTPLDTDHITFPTATKDTMMLKPGTASSEVLSCSEMLNAPLPTIEATRFVEAWMAVWKEKWAARVTVPVLFVLVQGDPFFLGTADEVDACVRAFPASSRVEGRLVTGGRPHCLELSLWATEWYSFCFGFAVECACL